MKIELNEEQKASLITSLLGFVRRVAFQGAESECEAGDFFLIVNLLLNNPVALELDLDALTKTEEPRESENSGKGGCCESCCRAGFADGG